MTDLRWLPTLPLGNGSRRRRRLQAPRAADDGIARLREGLPPLRELVFVLLLGEHDALLEHDEHISDRSAVPGRRISRLDHVRVFRRVVPPRDRVKNRAL